MALVLAACAGEEQPTTPPTKTPSSQTSPPAATSPTATTPPPQPREFTVVATGDILLHERLWVQAQRDAAESGREPMDFAPQLASIKPIVKGADLGICHLETPLAPEEGPYEGYPLFSSPPQILNGLRQTGYDACTTGSNHTFDQGADGVDRSLDALDEAGLAHAGSARTKKEAKRPTLIPVDTPNGRVTVGLMSYTYGFNGLPYPDGDTWRANEIDKKAILADAARARKGGAEFVIVALHWGDEYVHDPNELQMELAPELIKSADIDLLLGHHAHVVQPVEKIDDEWVVYGMGNLMAAHRAPDDPRSEGLLMRFTVRENMVTNTFGVQRAEYLPLLQTDAMPVDVINVPTALADDRSAGTASEDRLRLALDRTKEIVISKGASKDGLRLIRALK